MDGVDMEARPDSPAPPPARRSKAMQRFLVALNILFLGVGTTAGQLVARLYYTKGGSRKWLSAWLQTGGWPLSLIPLAISYAGRRSHDRNAPVVLTPPRLLLATAALGVVLGADDFLYTYGLEFLPVSTSAILFSTQLVFTVFFAFVIVRQKITAPTVNAVLLLTVGTVVLGLHVSSDRPPGVTKAKYWLGFCLTLGAALLYGPYMPLVELVYKHAAGRGRAVTYALVIETQLVMGLAATAFCTVGMIVNKDFQVCMCLIPPHLVFFLAAFYRVRSVQPKIHCSPRKTL